MMHLAHLIAGYVNKMWQKILLINLLLTPFSVLYYIYEWIRYFISRNKQKKVQSFVICIGSSYVGGAGKTPICIAVSKVLSLHFKHVVFISRGYGGVLSSKGKAYKVDLKRPDAAYYFSDEACLLAKYFDTYICIDRYKAAQLAVKNGADCIIMDDGLQNFTLHKDFSIQIKNQQCEGNGLYLPAGPLRVICQNSSLVLDINDCNMTEYTNADPNKSYLAFCSIGMPQKFKATLNRLGIKVKEFISFKDHYMYDQDDIARLDAIAKQCNLSLITTAKDMVKLPASLGVNVVEIDVSLPKYLLDAIEAYLFR